MRGWARTYAPPYAGAHAHAQDVLPPSCKTTAMRYIRSDAGRFLVAVQSSDKLKLDHQLAYASWKQVTLQQSRWTSSRKPRSDSYAARAHGRPGAPLQLRERLLEVAPDVIVALNAGAEAHKVVLDAQLRPLVRPLVPVAHHRGLLDQ